MSLSTRHKADWVVRGYTIPRPSQEFPLTPMFNGTWAKKVGGKLFYFKRWMNVVGGQIVPLPGFGAAEALAAYNGTVRDAVSGKRPTDPAAVTVGQLCSAFVKAMVMRLGLTEDEYAALAVKDRADWWRELKTRSGRRMSPRCCLDYRGTADRLVQQFGKGRAVADLRPADFAALGRKLADRFGVVRFGNEVQRTRTIFKWGVDNDELTAPPRYGSEFKKPDRTALRKHRAAQGPKVFSPAECERLLDAAGQPLRAMIWLGLNAALGNDDVARLPLAALDLDAGWVEFARGKTGIARKARLWPETVACLREAIAVRPVPLEREHAGFVFLSVFGRCWEGNVVASEFHKVKKTAGINGGRRGFYSCRHTFRTAADGSGDLGAVRHVMGHVDGGIDSVYTHGIEDARLERVSEFVRAKLLGT